MKRYLLSVALLLISVSVSAEISFENVHNLTTPPDALTGSFEQSKYLAEFETSIDSRGSFSYRREQEIVWHTEEPIESQLIMTPKEIISRQNGQELMRLDADENVAASILSRVFFAIMTADWNALSPYFSLTGKQTGHRWHLQLMPIDSNIATTIKNIELWGAGLLDRVHVAEQNGDYTDIKFASDTP